MFVVLEKEAKNAKSISLPFFFLFHRRIGVAMKRSSSLQRCAGNCVGRECSTELALDKGRQAVIRMLGKL